MCLCKNFLTSCIQEEGTYTKKTKREYKKHRRQHKQSNASAAANAAREARVQQYDVDILGPPEIYSSEDDVASQVRGQSILFTQDVNM